MINIYYSVEIGECSHPSLFLYLLLITTNFALKSLRAQKSWNESYIRLIYSIIGLNLNARECNKLHAIVLSIKKDFFVHSFPKNEEPIHGYRTTLSIKTVWGVHTKYLITRTARNKLP